MSTLTDQQITGMRTMVTRVLNGTGGEPKGGVARALARCVLLLLAERRILLQGPRGPRPRPLAPRAQGYAP